VVTVLRIRGIGLPDGEPIDPHADGDRWTTSPVAGAELVAEGWLLPGLTEDAPADAVEFDADPRTDLGQFDRPRAVIVRGKRVGHRSGRR
jgi:hypothetical protein